MDYYESSQGSKVRVFLTDEELQLPAIDDLCQKYMDWLQYSKECSGGRKTRSANRKADVIYDEIMSFKLPPIKLNPIASPIKNPNNAQPKIRNSVDTSMDSDSDSSSSRPITRSLRPRSRTPQIKTRAQPRQMTSPSTPAHQRIRAYMKNGTGESSNNSSGGSSNVLSAALNQQHPSISVTKIRQLLRADSAQKKRDEEKERHERMRLDRRAKEERAEAQKRQLLEERAANAKLKREQRLHHAAEVRKAREEAKRLEKLREDAKRFHNIQQTGARSESEETVVSADDNRIKKQPAKVNPIVYSASGDNRKQHEQQPPQPQDREPDKVNDATFHKNNKLDETFKKPTENVNNIDISTQDETADETKTKAVVVANWAKAPYLRDILIKQYSRPEKELLEEALRIFGVELPVDLDKIFGTNSVNARYLSRTSSAVWLTPPNRQLKRSSSAVLTPQPSKR